MYNGSTKTVIDAALFAATLSVIGFWSGCVYMSQKGYPAFFIVNSCALSRLFSIVMLNSATSSTTILSFIGVTVTSNDDANAKQDIIAITAAKTKNLSSFFINFAPYFYFHKAVTY